MKIKLCLLSRNFTRSLWGAFLICGLLGAIGSGCAVTKKSDLTQHLTGERVVVTPNNDVVAPLGASVTINSNPPKFSMRGFLFGYPAKSLVFHTDTASDKYTGAGKFLLADPAFAALESHHTNQTLLGGNSSFSVGTATVTVSTNGINAAGTAGSSLINSIGSATGSIIGQAAHTTVTGTP